MSPVVELPRHAAQPLTGKSEQELRAQTPRRTQPTGHGDAYRASSHEPLELIPSSGNGAAEPYRKVAAEALTRAGYTAALPGGILEFASLLAFEASLRRGEMPAASSQEPPLVGLAALEGYRSALQATLKAPLPPAVLAVLSDLDPQLLMKSSSYGTNTSRSLGQLAWSQDLAGELEPAAVLSPFKVKLFGAADGAEAANLQTALEEYQRRTGASPDRLLESVHLRPYIGESRSSNREGAAPIAGQFGGSSALWLLNSVAADERECRRVLFHEMGHQLDARLGGKNGFISRSPDSPFGKTSRPEDFVSGYSETDPCEDFAETHEFLLEHWHEVTSQPDLYLHANGKLGQKLAFILERGYGVSLPPSDRFVRLLEEVDQGRSPFGWLDARGCPVAPREDLERSARALLQVKLRPDDRAALPDAITTGRRAWLESHLAGQNPQSAQPRKVQDLVDDLARLGNIQAELDRQLEQASAQLRQALDALNQPPAPPPPEGQAMLKRLEQRSQAFDQAQDQALELPDGALSPIQVTGCLTGLLEEDRKLVLSRMPADREGMLSRLEVAGQRAHLAAVRAGRDLKEASADPAAFQAWKRRVVLQQHLDRLPSPLTAEALEPLLGPIKLPIGSDQTRELLRQAHQQVAQADQALRERLKQLETERQDFHRRMDEESSRLRAEKESVGGRLLAELAQGGEPLAAALDQVLGADSTGVAHSLAELRQAWRERPWQVASLLHDRLVDAGSG
ncbi:hypothetical protein DYH09_28915 [bacterium CPR1]|nr:hypothetical protein [bacterium CPR1]